MSYDIHLEIDTGGPDPAQVCDVGNYTWNCSAMFERAIGCVLSELDGQVAGEWKERLWRGYRDMLEDPEPYRAMNPPNGWGDYESATEYLHRIAVAASRHPRARIRVC